MATVPHDGLSGPRPLPDAEYLVARIRAEYVAADGLLILLAGHAARRNPVRGWDHLAADQQAATVAAMTEAASRVLGWRPLPTSGPMAESASRASFAVADAVADAVAAISLRETAADVAAQLATGWAAATRVHIEIRQLGPGAQSIAARLLTGWQQPIPLLPAVLRGLLAEPPHPPQPE